MGNIKNYIIITIFLGITGCTLDPVPDCVPGQVTCDKTTSQLKVCGKDAGNWADRLTCPNSCNEDGTSCKSFSDPCNEGYKKCISAINSNKSISLFCHEGTLFPKICQNGCDESTGDCIPTQPCTENEQVCLELNEPESLIVQASCNEGSWTSKYCESGTHCIGNSCQCEEGTTSCTDGILKQCTNGTWGKETMPCPGGASCDGNKCGKCANGSSRCHNDEVTKTGRMEICNNGKWELQNNCPNNSSCLNETSCGSCEGNYSKCENDESTNFGIISTCKQGNLIITPCDHVPCNETDDGCAKCTTGATKCDNLPNEPSQISTCDNDGTWQPTGDCGSNASCNAKQTDCGECINDTTHCLHKEQDKGTIEKCKDGAWVVVSECSNSCNKDFTACGQCTNNTIKNCVEENNIGIITKCIDGEYQKLPCEYDHPCNSTQSDCGIYCKADEIKCEDVDKIGKRYNCVHGNWSFLEDCETTSCTEDMTCGECQNGTSMCAYCGRGFLHYCTKGTFNRCQSTAIGYPCGTGYPCYHGGTSCNND